MTRGTGSWSRWKTPVVGAAGLLVGLMLGLTTMALIGGGKPKDTSIPVVPVAQNEKKQPEERPANPVPPTASMDKAAKDNPLDKGGQDPEKTKKVKELLKRAATAGKANQWASALADATEVLDIDSDNADALFIRGSANSILATSGSPPPDMARWQKGLDDLKKAAGKNPGHREFYETSLTRFKRMAALMGID